jgi:hypothetical protein
MSGGQVELEWGAGAASAAAPVGAGGANGSATATYLTDEEILGIGPPSSDGDFGGRARLNEPSDSGDLDAQGRRGELGRHGEPGNAGDGAAMPAWMQAAAGDPAHGAEAQRLWREHQEFRAAFGSPDEARAIKEIFPGGAQEAQTLKQASQSVERIDAAIFSGDVRAQSEVVAELARANPAAFRSLFAEAARVLGVEQSLFAGGDGAQNGTRFRDDLNGPTLRQEREGWGTRQTNFADRDDVDGHPPSRKDGFGGLGPHPSRDLRASQSPVASHQLPATSEQSAATGHQSSMASHQSGAFDPAAYASFERTTNDVVARDVRSTIGDTLARVLPEGVADGAARRIGDDIFNEVHRALAEDRALAEQVGATLRGPVAGQGWRFGSAEQQRVAAMLAGRARQLVPSVARRVIGEWTSSVLGTARSKAARQAAAASRVDISATGGSLDSMPLRAMSRREVDYASMSDDEILGM